MRPFSISKFSSIRMNLFAQIDFSVQFRYSANWQLSIFWPWIKPFAILTAFACTKNVYLISSRKSHKAAIISAELNMSFIQSIFSILIYLYSVLCGEHYTGGGCCGWGKTRPDSWQTGDHTHEYTLVVSCQKCTTAEVADLEIIAPVPLKWSL